jgi:hypothetical protein
MAWSDVCTHQSARMQIVNLIVINLDPQRTIVSHQTPRLAHWRKSVVAIDEPVVKQVVVRHPLPRAVSALETFQQNARLHSRDRWFSPIRVSSSMVLHAWRYK